MVGANCELTELLLSLHFKAALLSISIYIHKSEVRSLFKEGNFLSVFMIFLFSDIKDLL